VGEHKHPNAGKKGYKSRPHNPMGENRVPGPGIYNREWVRKRAKHLGFIRNMRRRGFNFNG
jgi:hypothetical protein